MIFRGPVYNAIMGVVKEKIKGAEEIYQNTLEANRKEYETEVLKASEIKNTKDSMALSDAVNAVVGKLL